MILDSMCKLALGDLVGNDAAEGIAGFGGLAGGVALLLHQHFADHSQRLPNALHRANRRAWKTLELALAGDGWLTKMKNLLARGEDKAIAGQIRAFLEVNCLKELERHPDNVRQACLEDVQNARAAGALEGGQIDGPALAEEAKSWQGLQEPQARLQDDLQRVARMAAHLRDRGYAHLGWLLELQVHQQHSLLVVAVRYYFRREVEGSRELFQGLTFARLEQLDQQQARGFAELNLVLANQWDLLDELLKRSAATLEAAHGARTAAEAGHAAVLDLKEELQRQVAVLGQQQKAEFEKFYQPIVQMLEKLQLHSRPVQTTDSMSIHTDRDRAEAEALVKHYRALPPEQRRRFPALLNGLGRLEFAVNDFASAQQMFAEVATIAPDARSRALAHFNAYRAALEQKKYDDALAALQQAAALDPQQFTPFPLHRYQPRRILGAGGFGAAFLCHDRNFAADVVVKVLHGADLEQGVESVFREARLLKALLHPGIIGIHDCEYADPLTRTRPYLVMDYFPGQTLEEFVGQHGPLKPHDFLSVARPVAEALAAAHRRDILHRDIKPANLLVRRDGGNWQVRVIDFGLAMRQGVLSRASTSASRQQRTLASDCIAGTIDFAAPEQLGKFPGVPVGPPADVYGFGRTGYYLLLRTPDPDDDEKERLPEGLRRLLGQCTARLPEKRPQSFQEVLKGLGGLTARSTPTHAPPIPAVIPVVSIPPTPPVPPPPRMPTTRPVMLRLAPESAPTHGGPPPLPVQAELIQPVLPVRLVGAIPVALPAERPEKDRSTADGIQVRIFGKGATPNWLERLGKTPRKLKVYFDGEFIGEGDDWQGIDLRTPTKPGRHTILIKTLENVSPTLWKVVVQEVSKAFAVEFPEAGKYSVRFDYLERGKLELVTADVMRARG